jgi:hypothetical protein
VLSCKTSIVHSAAHAQLVSLMISIDPANGWFNRRFDDASVSISLKCSINISEDTHLENELRITILCKARSSVSKRNTQSVRQELAMIESSRGMHQEIGGTPSLANQNQHSRRSMNSPNCHGLEISPGVNRAERHFRTYEGGRTQMPPHSVPSAQRFQIILYYAGILTAACIAVAAT